MRARGRKALGQEGTGAYRGADAPIEAQVELTEERCRKCLGERLAANGRNPVAREAQRTNSRGAPASRAQRGRERRGARIANRVERQVDRRDRCAASQRGGKLLGPLRWGQSVEARGHRVSGELLRVHRTWSRRLLQATLIAVREGTAPHSCDSIAPALTVRLQPSSFREWSLHLPEERLLSKDRAPSSFRALPERLS